ncbi:MAG: hypothetical protein GY714_01095 [Desulfobacterales bacterium]|nr:hypothetical protein [Desulfobacterales bacterium]MCP4158446.1 hypothetical protein [Deltaproteobacteria bacterium]
MKRGLILYITGNEPTNLNLNSKNIAKMIGTDDTIEFVSESSGRSDLHEAWFNLVVKGNHSIKCQLAKFGSDGSLQLTDKEMRIC